MISEYTDPRLLAVEAVRTGDNIKGVMEVVHWMQDLNLNEASWLAWAVQYGLQRVTQMSSPVLQKTEAGEVWDI